MVKKRGLKAWVIIAIVAGTALGGCHRPVRDAGGRYE
jgi:hypothetical protein